MLKNKVYYSKLKSWLSLYICCLRKDERTERSRYMYYNVNFCTFEEQFKIEDLSKLTQLSRNLAFAEFIFHPRTA